MTVEMAELRGVQGYQSGRGRAPALNNAFVKEACESSTKTSVLLGAYLRGWDIASLADGVNDPTMPSVIELKRITGEVESV